MSPRRPPLAPTAPDEIGMLEEIFTPPSVTSIPAAIVPVTDDTSIAFAAAGRTPAPNIAPVAPVV